ncbi:ricin-type beta-trefoil lectin domain protein [Streptomyces broussonetiae]|uniref:RICIN domain-containing protein n=1 Tax=Streptomyces broussonetiae TaxID=2686304 RepID=A0ABV5EEH3_9ACTN
MSAQYDGTQPPAATGAAAASGTPRVRQAFALPAAPAGAPEPTPPSGPGPATEESGPCPRTRTDGETGPVPVAVPVPAPGPGFDADADADADGAPAPAPRPAATTAPEPSLPPTVPDTPDKLDAPGSPRTSEASEAAADGVAGRVKKPVLAAAAIAGAVLVAVPFLITGPDRDRTGVTAKADPSAGTVLDGQEPERPGRYVVEAPSPSGPSGSPSKSASGGDGGEKATRQPVAPEPDTTPAKATTTARPPKAGAAAGAADTSEAKATSTPAKEPTESAVAVVGDTLVSKDSGKCLSSGPGTDGTQLMLWTCNGSAAQRWDFRPDGTIRSQGLCMDVAWGSTQNGTAIQVARCSGNPAQQFYLNSTDDLVATIATKCVDIYDGQTGNGTPAVLWPCTGTANQTWYRR